MKRDELKIILSKTLNLLSLCFGSGGGIRGWICDGDSVGWICSWEWRWMCF